MSVETTRNSPLREAFKDPLTTCVDFIDQEAPGVTPDIVTSIGGAGVGATSVVAAVYPETAKVCGPVSLFFLILDAVDGELARIQGVNNWWGPLLDATVDKLEEFAVGVSLSVIAEKKGTTLGSAIHVLNAMSSPLPALYRSRAESRGNIVPEGGLGTRPVRAFLGALAITVSDKPYVSEVIGAATLTQNLITAAKRSRAVNPDSRYCVGFMKDKKAIKAAEQKYKTLKILTLGTTATGSAILFHKLKKEYKKRQEKTPEAEEKEVPVVYLATTEEASLSQ